MDPSPDVTLAVLSDIHGNRWALEAVLADISGRGLREIVNLGDSLYGPLDPAGTAELLVSLDVPTVRGNEDRIIVEPDANRTESATLRYVTGVLSPDHLDWLGALEMTVVVQHAVRMFHGTSERDDEYLVEAVNEEKVRSRDGHELVSKLASIREPAILCGHSHVPRSVRLPDGKLVVNPGSVGLQAFTDDVPHVHIMQTGTPHARYAVLTRSGGAWEARQVLVEYDWDAAAVMAQTNGRTDWAGWLRTGRAE
ncbi:MAG: metallophosphoesterase family protein [Phycisphaerae bacterium]|jgi:predicted phosphodiesterase